VTRDDVDQQAAVARAVTRIRSSLDDLADLLERIREPVEAGLAASAADVPALGYRELTALLRDVAAPHCTAALGATPSVAGVGCVAQSPAEVGEAFAMVWWVSRNGVVSEKRHDLNPTSDAFYDYRDAEWFSVPRTTGGFVVAGPYIDAWGTDDLTITAGVPLRAAGRAIGVVALDVATARFVGALTEALDELPGDAVLVNADGRVVASTAPDLSTGLRLTPRSRAATGAPAGTAVPAGARGWSLVLVPGADATA
jgi:methyl-accepting chemotaxis protein-like sensor